MNLVNAAELFNTLLPVAVILVALIWIVVVQLKKKGIIGKKSIKETETDMSKVQRVPVQEFNVVEDIRDNCVITEGSNKFSMGLRCVGVSYDKLSPTERKIIVDNYIGLYNMMDWDTQYYVQGRLMDVKSNVQYIEEQLDYITKERDILKEKLNSIEKIIAEAPSRSETYQEQKAECERLLKSLEWQIGHKYEEIDYAQKVASPDSQPQFDTYIIVSYEHDENAYTTKLTPEEIYNKAKTDIEIKLTNIAAVLRKCSVECTILDRAGIAEVMYRAYNLSYADEVGLEELTNTIGYHFDELYTKNEDYAKVQLEHAAEVLRKSIETDENRGRGVA